MLQIPRSGGGGPRILTRRDFLRVAGAGATGAVLLGGSSCGSGTEKSSVEETSDEKTDAKTPNTKRMNVILVILDSLRRDHVGAFGNHLISTPTLDALAVEGLRFSRAHPEAMPTIPARRAIHTGFRTWPTRVPTYGWRPIPEEQPTLAEILKGQGYRTLLYELRPRIRRLPHDPRPGERPLQAPLIRLRGRDA